MAPGDSARVPAAALAPEPGHAAPAAAASEAGQAHAPANATVAAAGGPDVARAEQEARSLAGVRVVFVLGGPGSGKGTQARPAGRGLWGFGVFWCVLLGGLGSGEGTQARPADLGFRGSRVSCGCDWAAPGAVWAPRRALLAELCGV